MNLDWLALNRVIVDELLWFYLQITLSRLNHFIYITHQFHEHFKKLVLSFHINNP